MNTAIITGITGQDGAYLAELLLKKGYNVIGFTRSLNSSNLDGLRYLNIIDKVILEEVDLNDQSQIYFLLNRYNPTEIYNLAAQSSVFQSFRQPVGTIQFNVLSTLHILEAIRITNKNIKFYQASSSEIFGNTRLPIHENEVINPLSPYGISKATAHWITKNYREAFGIFSCSGILFNHESYLRSTNFFIKKVIRAAVDIHKGIKNELRVGNIDVKRDFGWAPKYVEAMYLMLQMENPDDYVICSGRAISLREIIYYVFDFMNLDKSYIIEDNELFRPTDIKEIYGDNTKAKLKLGWNYNFSFFEVLDILIKEEIENA